MGVPSRMCAVSVLPKFGWWGFSILLTGPIDKGGCTLPFDHCHAPPTLAHPNPSLKTLSIWRIACPLVKGWWLVLVILLRLCCLWMNFQWWVKFWHWEWASLKNRMVLLWCFQAPPSQPSFQLLVLVATSQQTLCSSRLAYLHVYAVCTIDP